MSRGIAYTALEQVRVEPARKWLARHLKITYLAQLTEYRQYEACTPAHARAEFCVC